MLCNYAEHDLNITNTLFQKNTMYKTIWMHPCSKHWHLLAYVIVRAYDQQEVSITRAMCGTVAFLTDHRLVRSIMTICLARKHRKRPKTSSKKYNVEFLQDSRIRTQLQSKIEDKDR